MRRIIESERLATRRLHFKRINWMVFFDAAFEYDSLLDYSSHNLLKLVGMTHQCPHCGALKWKAETPGMCCSAGKIKKV